MTNFHASLSEEDLALIQVLQIAPRAGWTDVGAVLGIHPTSAAARWERLTTSGAAWVTAHPMGDPQEVSLSFIGVDAVMEDQSQVVDKLCAMPEIITVEQTASSRALVLTVITESMAQLSGDVIPRLRAIDGVLGFDVSLCTRQHFNGSSWRLNVLSRGQQQHMRELARTEHVPGHLPQSHLDLLPFLARDGRATAASMARELGRTAATVQRQLNRVLASGTVSLRCDMAQSLSGYPVTCQWFAKVPAGQHEAAAATLRRLRNVRFIASTTGQSNFTIIMWLRSVADIMDVELTLQQNIPDIELQESVVMLACAKRVGRKLRPDGTALAAVAGPGTEVR
ncbi:AsnC family transcriptional regulator [Arthrobacter livingstonensis]|uniref:AsnC family transcriptional regulator n=1 Tax=Arthrobacter livingstonensis TaxID=670078 RepID=A0A2V5LGK3_9MICC|nr:AsnC family transcriptional regulator [Arthrobacter livingstonensis]PYI65600.1 AsnC family transcriptional regulator [Arthrobacter livingstonensis]